MFSNIAKSAEAMFSRWAIKKVCKFLLKKKLGQFILGDIDLNQLDVQLSAGTIQLSDLALNVDYINGKLGAVAALTVKEGSIGSLTATMPWKGKGCQIEVDELELVLGPGGRNSVQVSPKTCFSGVNGQGGNGDDLGTYEPEIVDATVTTTSVDVHEGVKTIAKMVKWLLTSFHVKVKKLIVAFDPYLVDEKNKGFCRTLVLRIIEVECGTGTSEDFNSDNHVTVDNFLGLNWLTNFVKFQGANLEFLHMDVDSDKQSTLPCASGTTFGEWFKGSRLSNATTPIVTGVRGGFSGSVKLSIPWKNGSLDIRKVDADVYIDPLELRFQPSSVECFLHLWNMYKDVGESGKDQMHSKETESVYYNALSSTIGSCTYTSEKVLSNHGSSSPEICSPMGKETATDTLLPGSHLISDWVSSISRNQRDRTEAEPDFGASVDQFFECFDELRTSQSALGNSGMWNWTCSVFSAITAASNLASGSIHIPSDQKHAETNFKATVAGVSLIFSLVDEDEKHQYDHTNAHPVIHYLGVDFQSMLFILQVRPQEMDLKATVERIELADYFSGDEDVLNSDLHGYTDVGNQAVLIGKMQAAVEGALPISTPVEHSRNSGSINRNDVVKVILLRTSGVTECQLTVTFGSSNNSFSLKLPPLVFWLNFHLVSMTLDLLKKITDSVETTSPRNISLYEAHDGKPRSSSRYKAGKISSSPEGSLRGNIFLPNARIILCFPFEKGGDFRNYTYWDQFIALDFTSPSSSREEEAQASKRAPVIRSKRWSSSVISRSLHLNVGDLGIYLITSASKDTQNLKYFAQIIASATNQTSHLSVLSMLWQDGHLTSPWIAKRAKLLATLEDSSSSREKFVGKGHDFTSVTTIKDMEDMDTRTQEEMIMSSSFILHAHLAPVNVNLGISQYKSLNDLLHQLTDWLSCLASNIVDLNDEPSAPQSSIFVECDFIGFQVSLEASESIKKSSIQNELPGVWHSFKLQIQKFELLSISNIGGINGSDFFWMSHAEGNLWGSVTVVPTKEFLLISCSNSTMGRGDGEGSNVLSSRFSGSDIVHLWDPENSVSHTSITVRCGTIVAIGGRLDWVDTVFSFFIVNDDSPKGDSEKSEAGRSSFVVNLVDVGLSYEPYLGVGSGYESSSANSDEVKEENYFACVLAASSLKISNRIFPGTTEREYKIRVQELGLLLCPVSGLKLVSGPYSVEHLRSSDYVKVAQEAHVEALFRMNCMNGHVWELECRESHVVLETCHDTASGLIHLAAQLQQLFAPDVEESAVHLQNRWKSIQKANVGEEVQIFGDESSLSTSQVDNSSVVNLMDEICEDAFQLKPNTSLNDGRLVRDPERLMHSLSYAGPMPLTGLESKQTSLLHKISPELIEGYFLSDLCPLSELSLHNKPSNETSSLKDQESQRGKSGWYGDVSLRILENHVSERHEEGKAPNHTERGEGKNIKGNVILKNINVIWRLHAGSDWHNFQENNQHSANFSGRDTTTCLELGLSGMDLQYDVYPEGEICVSRLYLSIMDFCLNDNSINAPWKMVLGYYHSKDHPRDTSSKALKLDLEAVRPHPSTPLEEYRLQIAILPLRLHLHQCQLDFFVNFFGGKKSSMDQSRSCAQDSGEPRVLPEIGGHNVNEEALLPYFQKFDIWPVIVRVDYSPYHVDLAALRGGKYVELVNLVPWKGVELQLKHVRAKGVYGWSCVCETIVGEWLEDISQNQVHKLLGGLPPIRSLVAVGSGAAKLVSLPVKNYRKDHRLLKGMQRGTIAFLRSISLEAIGLGVHLAAGAHEILLQAEYILTTIPPSVPCPPVQSRINTNVRSNQPKDARQGIQQACESISDGFGKSASALVQTPIKRYQRGAGAGSALATVVQAAPAAVIAPASAAARAMHCALLGVRNSLDLEHKKESMDKYLGKEQPR